MNRQLIAGALALAGITGWLLWPDAGPPDRPAGGAPAVSARAGAGTAGLGQSWFHAVPEGAMEPKRVPLTPVDSGGSAWLSMSEARVHGDSRSPPVRHDQEESAPPTAAELADPQAYRRYEQGQHARMLGAYANAAQAELPRLRADVERGRAAGIAPERIAKLEEKIRRIEQQRQLILRDHPEAAASR